MLLLNVTAEAAAQLASQTKAEVPSAVQLQPPGIKPGVEGESVTASLHGALAKAGRFNTFLSVWDAAQMEDWERNAKARWDGDGKTGFADGSVRGVTILAPNDAAFAKMDKAKLNALLKDKGEARAFILAHIISQPLKVNDMFYADNPTSEKLVKAAGGGEFKLLCNGRAHVGPHHPRINGLAKVGDLQDVAICCGVVQEIDGVLTQ
jgi:hypothetical protein